MIDTTGSSNTRAAARHALVEYMKSDKRVALLTGTFQHEKHVLALQCVVEALEHPSRLLFRTNSTSGISRFLSPVFGGKRLSGREFRIEDGHTLYADSINSSSWGKTPNEIDVAIVYPIDSLDLRTADMSLEDLRRRGVRKMILVTWTDNFDLSWAGHLEPIRITFDAEEERPDYHNRMKRIVSKPSRRRQRKIPEYAKHVPDNRLVRIHCDGRCHGRGSRWARLNRDHPGISTLNSAQDLEYTATCLKCGFEATDNYNWLE